MKNITTIIGYIITTLALQAHCQRLSPATSMTVLYVPQDTTISICGKIGAGASVKGCIGTGGSTLGAAGGVGVTTGGSITKGWDGSITKCVEVGAGGGAGPYATGSLDLCQKNGQSYQKTSEGIGVGAGPNGAGAALYVQFSQMTPIRTGNGGGGGGAGGSDRAWQPQTTRLMCPTPNISHHR